MSSEGATARAGARDAVPSSSPNASSSPDAAANRRRHHVAWALVARRLDAAWDVCALSCVARSLAAIARDDDVWRALCATRGVERGVDDDEGGGVLDASPEDRRRLPSWRDAFARRTRDERRAWASARRSALRVAEAEHRERVRAARRAASELRAESRRATEARAKARAAVEGPDDDEEGGEGAETNRRVERRRRARPVSWHRARCASFARTNAARVAEDAATRAAIRRSRAEAEARASEEALERERRRARFYDGGRPSAKVV